MFVNYLCSIVRLDVNLQNFTENIWMMIWYPACSASQIMIDDYREQILSILREAGEDVGESEVWTFFLTGIVLFRKNSHLLVSLFRSIFSEIQKMFIFRWMLTFQDFSFTRLGEGLGYTSLLWSVRVGGTGRYAVKVGSWFLAPGIELLVALLPDELSHINQLFCYVMLNE